MNALSFAMAFCSFSYEILFAFVIAKITGFDILSQTLSIGSFILGLGLGSFWIEKYPQKNSLRFLLRVELALSLLGGLGLFYIFGLDALFVSLYGQVPLIIFFVLVQLYILLIGFLSGLELPCLLDQKNSSEDKVLGFHYMGTLVAALLLFSWLIPGVDVFNAAIFIALLNAVLALVLYVLAKPGRIHLLGLGFVSLALSALLLAAPAFYSQYLKVYYYQPEVIDISSFKHAIKILDTRPDIRRYRSQYQYIDFIDEVSADGTALLMFLDHRFQFSSTHEKIYHEHMVHVPQKIFAQPLKKVLILGGGDGLLARELLKYSEIEKIQLIELDPDIVNFSSVDLRLTEINKNSLSDPRVNVEIADAISYVRKTTEKFDAVFLDFPYPNNYDLAKLYSIEFYKALKKLLNDKAFIILDYPIDKDTLDSAFRNEVVLSTLHFSGFKNLMIFGKEDTFVMANNDNEPVDYSAELNIEYLSKRSQAELMFRTDLIGLTEVSKKRVNSIFKPQTIQMRRKGW